MIWLIHGILYSIVFFVNGCSIMSVIYSLMASALFILSLIDWRTYEIPPVISLFLGVLGVVATIIDDGQMESHLIGLFCVSGFLQIIYWMTAGEAIGGGDIKLMAACGLLIGWRKIILAFFLGCFLASCIQLIRIRFFGASHTMAMGPYLSVGIFLAALFG